ncbi:MAG: VRR-NUC domain-containing protein [Halomonas sp.]
MTAPRRKRTTSPMKPRRRAGQAKRQDDPESREQQALIRWANWLRIPDAEDVEPGARIADYLIAIPNGGLRHHATAGKLKAEGAKAGVSDLQLPLARRGHVGLWIEMKAPSRRPKTPGSPTGESDDQIAWGKRMTQVGHLYRVAYTMTEAANLIAWYLEIPHTGLQGDRICPANPPS